MNNTKIHEKRNNNKPNDRISEEVQDRISTLPDDILGHILSFLSTKEAVQTCVLTKRWRHAWKSVPVLKFHLDEFLTSISDLENDGIREEAEDKFEELVNGVLANRAPSLLDKFRYVRYLDENSSDASLEWLDQVALLMPRVVSILVYKENLWDMPLNWLIFSSDCLQELELSLYSNLKNPIRPKSINLPSLKVLELCAVDLDEDFALKLFSGCPVLENIYLAVCDLGFSNVTSKVLKRLVLEECVQLEQLQICCPCLDYLKVDSLNQDKGISLKNTISLANANILVSMDDKIDGDLDLLSGLSNVSTLKIAVLSAELMENLERNIPYCTSFDKLRRLDLGKWKDSKHTKLFSFFLRNSPHLQELTLNLAGYNLSEDEPEEQNQAESVVNLQREYLETLRILNGKHDALVQEVIENLHSYVKKIGQIITN